MAKTLHISIIDKVATCCRRDGDIVCGNNDYQIEFAFDSEWDAYGTKTARFIWNGKHWDQPFTGNICPVPIIKNTESVSVGVYAGDLSTTTPATILSKRSILCDESEIYDVNIEACREEAVEAAERAEAAAERAEAAAEKVVPPISILTLAPRDSWYKGSISKEQITKINIIDSYAVTGNETETWNADANNTGSIKCYRNGTVVTIVGGGYGAIYTNADSSNMFRGFTSLKIIVGLELLNTRNITNANSMFRECHELRYVDVSKFDTHNFTDVEAIFFQCRKLKTIDTAGWDLSNAVNTNAMFLECIELEELITSGWNICKSTQLSSMFNHCDKLKSVDVSGWDTSQVTTIENMFYCCFSLEDIDVSNWDVSKVTIMDRAFEGCTSLKTLDMSNWNTGKVSRMNFIFEAMVRLQKVTLGANFKFQGTNCYLPTPNSGYIPNANGRWKDTATSNDYSPVEVVQYHNGANKVVTYEAMRA